MAQPANRLTIGLLVISLSGSQQFAEVACDPAGSSEGCRDLLASAPNWGEWLSGRDTRVSTHFLDLLELLTRNGGSRGGNR